MQVQRLGLIAALATASSWGGMFSIMAHMLHTLDPYWLTTIRYVGASLVLCIALLAVEGPSAFRLDHRGWLLFAMGTAGIAGFNLLMLNGMERSGPEHAALLAATGPAFVTLILWARTKTAPSRLTIATLIVAFIGVALVVTKGNWSTLAHGSASGDLLVTIAVIGISYYTAGASFFKDWSWLRFTTLSLGLGAISTVIATLVATMFGAAHVPHQVDTSVIVGMLYLILVAAVFAFIGWNYALAKIGPQNTALFMNAIPIVAFIVAVCFGRHIAPVEYAGAALTIGALVVNNVGSRRATL